MRAVRGFPARLAMAVLAFAAAGCGGSGAGARRDLILISVDTLRADRVGAYGYARETTPHLDALAERGVVFERVVAESGWTLPSQMTLLTGLHPATHGVVLPSLKPGAQTRMLAQWLRDAGYQTIGLTSGGHVSKRLDFDRGFAVFNDVRKGLPRLLSQAERYLAEVGKGERYFLFLHTAAVRCPYAPSQDYRGRFASPGAEPVETGGRCGSDLNALDLSPGQARYVSDRYDESIRELDDLLGGFLERLESDGRLANAVVMIVSDHGDAFLDHGAFGNEGSLHREVVMVPWIVVGPGIPATRVAALAGLADVAPTALDLVGVPLPDGLDGASLVPRFTAAAGGDRPADGDLRVSQQAWPRALVAVTTPEHRLIVDPESGEVQLYAWDDAAEERDLAGSRPELVASLREALETFARERSPRPTQAAGRFSDAQREQLRRLQQREE